MQDNIVRWGILGTGGIVGDFLDGASGSATGKVAAISARARARAWLASEFPGLDIYEGYDSLLSLPEVDAIYIATPHPFHAEWAIKAAQAGKHVLCEKPAGMNAAEVEAMIAAASYSGTFLGEAYMYRLHPITAFILDLLDAGKIGQLRMIRSSFGFAMPERNTQHRLFDPALGGGAILDVGGYPMSIARLLAGHAEGREGIEPVSIDGQLRRGPTGVDEIATATAIFSNGIIAQLSASITLGQDNVLQLVGTGGRLEVDAFWYGSGKQGGTAHIRFTPPEGQTELIPFTEERNVYSFQFEAANEAILAGRENFESPGMTHTDSLANARALDRWIAGARHVEPPLF
ncbi:hypothetical protein GCM10011494_39330 [Novosphingobium endophyticum]|uniref:Gfo/Idh/MocA family oxidoreductase n=1 Tax=Novosphingobium endophyticum TaxID=1955250 RepID=A0A916TW17_9SPHN|nr:Gfo/Idh/MocA family oxidoreductase [Novosphingobium endophyticum]GGC16573.1 hypothetical protein GCM10011494_39330 [Novosphingobium endophyticum]